MNNNEKFNNILNECLDKMLQGESVEQCLQRYPERAGELEPLLRTALIARKAAMVQPGAEFKARARYEFQAALQDMKARKSRRPSFFSWRWQWQSGWAIALMVILVVVLSGGGTVIASGNSMPDNTLYSVKLAAEKVQMAFTFSDIGKAELNAEFADKRVEEIIYMASQGNPQNVQVVAQRLNSNLAAMNSLVGDEANSRGPGMTYGALESTNNTLSQNSQPQQMMDAFVNNAPPSAEPGKGIAPPATSVASATVAAPATTLAQKNMDLGGGGSRFNPEPGATGVSNQPVFQWASVDGAVSYDLQVSDNPVFENPLTERSGLMQAAWTYEGVLDYGRTYYWRFRAVNADNIAGNWTASAFTVIAAQPSPVPAPVTGVPAPMITVAAPAAAQEAGGTSGSGFQHSNSLPGPATSFAEDGNSQKNNEAKIIDLEKLKQSISSKAATNYTRLEEALEKVSPEVRPALRQALAQAMAEYDKALKIIEQSIIALQ